jgi:hypothetical protein
MSDQSVDEIRGHYRAAARGEVGSLRWLDERIDVGQQRALGLSAIPESEPVDQPRWQPERFIDLRDRVLVRGKLSGRGGKPPLAGKTALLLFARSESGNPSRRESERVAVASLPRCHPKRQLGL